MMVRRLGTILFALAFSMTVAPAEAAPISNTSSENYVTVFGPNRYFSPLVGSKTHTASFSVSPAPSAGEITVTNGSGEDLSLESCNGLKALQKLACVLRNAARTVRMNLERPASAEISLNNVVVMRPQDLPRSTSRLVIPVQLRASNSIKIKLSGSPLSSIKVEVRGLDHAAPVLTLQAPSEGQIISDLSTSVSGSASERLSSAKAQLNNEPEIPLTLSSDGLSFSGDVSTAQNGAKVLTVTGYDLAGNSGAVSQNIVFHLNRPPTASLVLASSGSGTAPFTVLFDASSSSDPDGDQLTYRFDFDDGTVITSSLPKVSHEFKDVGNYSVEVRVSDPSGDSQTASVNVAAIAAEIPADPTPFAPPISELSAPPFSQTISFLYEGEHAVQKAVAPDAIKADRVATISGKVLDQDGAPLSGVRVHSLGKDQLGYTISRADGKFDLAVNMGGITTLRFERNGYAISNRNIDVALQEMYAMTDVMLVRRDAKVTPLTLGSEVTQIARGTASTDESGTRTATLFIPKSTQAEIELPNGSRIATDTLNIRLTEFTVGPNGPNRMPATLPEQTGYTYALEISADEAIAKGADHVIFSKPVAFYVDNFLSLPPGIAVPIGFLNPKTGYWEASEDGVVISVISHTAGLADLNIGAGRAATAAELTALGIDDDERRKIAEIYPVSQSFWRVRTNHLSSADTNGNKNVTDDDGEVLIAENDNNDETNCKGCVIDIISQSMKESIALPGTGTSLTYSTKRGGTREDKASVTVQVLGETYPNTIQRIEVVQSVAGTRKETTVLPSQNASVTLTWDGRDGFGRQLYSEQEMQIQIRYYQSATYVFKPYNPLDPATWASPSATDDPEAIETPTRINETTSVFKTARVRPPIDAATKWAMKEIGRWTFAQHHYFDRASNTLFMGNGEIHNASKFPKIVRHFAGVGGSSGFSGDGGPAAAAVLNFPRNFTFDNDGNVLIADRLNNRIRKVDRITRIISTIAGNGSNVFSGDGGPAVNAGLTRPLDLTVDRDGNIYISDNGANRIRKIDTNGIITTVAGNGTAGYSGDGGPAIDAQINSPRSVIANPDGSLYISEELNHVIRKVEPGGIIRTFAGTGVRGYTGDGGPATEAQFAMPNYTATDAAGNLYVAQTELCAIRKISPSGIVKTIAGTGTCGASIDGEPAIFSNIGGITSVAVSKDGHVYFGDHGNLRIRSIDIQDNLYTVVGTGLTPFNGNGHTGGSTNITTPYDVELRADGSFVFIDYNRNVLREFIQAPFRLGGQAGTIEIASPDGSEIYVFDESGKHLSTLFGETRATKYNFEYQDDRLSAMVDSSGNRTEIQRSAGGIPSAIRSPYGQVYSVQVDEQGGAEDLTQVTYPTGETYRLGYSLGRLTAFTKPSGATYTYEYLHDGRLFREQTPLGGFVSIGPGVRATGLGSYFRAALEQDRRGNSYTRTQHEDEVSFSATLESGLSSMNSPTREQENSFSDIDQRLQGLSRYQTRFEKFYTIQKSELTETTERTYTTSPGSFTRTDRTTTQDGWFQKVFNSSTGVYTSTTSEGRVATTTIDNLTRPTRVQVGSLEPTLLTYDARGRLSQVSQGVRTTDFTYDANGFLFETRDALGHVVRTQFDGSQKLISSTNANNETTSFAYDSNRNLSSILLPTNVVHGLISSAVDLLTSYQSPLGYTIGRQYSTDDELLRIDRPDGKSVRYNYQPNQKRSLASIQTEAQTIGIGYRPNTSLINSLQTSDGSSISYQYLGELPTQKVYTGPFTAGIGMSYRPIGRHLDTINVAGSAISIGYNSDREPSAVGQLAISREPQTGLLTGLQLSSVNETFGYSSYGELASKSVSGFGGESYIRDNLGRITQRTIAASILNEASNYTYDLAGRLSRVVRSGPFAGDIRYTYDSRGNRISINRNGAITSATFDSDDRILTQGDLRFTYTDNGDLLEKENIVTGQKITLTYDQRGQLTRAVLNSARTISYSIDGEGHRLTRSIDGVMQTGYLHDVSGRLVAEVEPSGALRSHFVYASQSHSPDYMIRGAQLYYFAKDNLGSVKAVIDANSGTIAQAIHYDEFGRVLVNTNPGFQPFGFAGGHFDHETGLVRFGARDYDPEVGRWVSKDPILFNGGQGNLYSAVMNDPVNNIDPSGLYLVTAGDWKGQAQIWKAIANLRKTCKGEELYQLLNNSDTTFTMRFRDDFTDFGSRAGSRHYGQTNEVVIDPRNIGQSIAGSSPPGGRVSLERILAHELGHAAGVGDTPNPGSRMDNVNRWENPIMQPLDGHLRTRY